MKPFRVKYLDYVSSKPIQTSDGLKYHVELAVPEGQPEPSFFDKYMQRDFGIGANVGALAGIGALAVIAMATPPAALVAVAFNFSPVIFGLVAAGAAIGGVSDYIRNSDQLTNKGVDIGEPKLFNRDAIMGALSWSTTAGLIAGVGMMAFSVITSSPIAVPIATAINVCTFIGGLAYGGVEGSKEGYHRMELEYKAAEEKYKNPDYKVILSQKKENQLDELVMNEAAVAATLLPMVIPRLAGLAQNDTASPVPSSALPSSQFSTEGYSHVAPMLAEREQVLI